MLLNQQQPIRGVVKTRNHTSTEQLKGLLLLTLTVVDKKLTAVYLFVQFYNSLVYKGVILAAVISEKMLFLALTLVLTLRKDIQRTFRLKTLLKRYQFTQTVYSKSPQQLHTQI